jgi:hypothetical protein
LKVTPHISHSRQIEKAIDASKVVGRDKAPLALGRLGKVASHDVAGPGILKMNVEKYRPSLWVILTGES